MQIDQKTIRRLLAMNDEKLLTLFGQIAQESGIPAESIGITPGDIRSIRSALSGATDADLEQMNRMYEEYPKNNRGGRR